MQISLRPTSYEAIQPWINDFHKRSKNCDALPNNAELLGIYSLNTLVGYFITTGYRDGDLEINHGYLSKEFRHKSLSRLSMLLLEQKAKRVGYKKVILASSRTLKAYTQFMAGMNYKPVRVIYSKEL